MKKYFEDNNYSFDHIVIEASPFLRTLMTALWIAKELGDCATIHVNYLLLDLLCEKHFGKENPIPKLEFTLAGCDFEKMKASAPEFSTDYFPEGISIVENSSDPVSMAFKQK